jgi:RNA polymerase II subunit A small phosphatase-like protein
MLRRSAATQHFGARIAVSSNCGAFRAGFAAAALSLLQSGGRFSSSSSAFLGAPTPLLLARKASASPAAGSKKAAKQKPNKAASTPEAKASKKRSAAATAADNGNAAAATQPPASPKAGASDLQQQSTTVLLPEALRPSQRVSVTFATSPDELTALQRQKYNELLQQPKNHSRVDPAKNPPLLAQPRQPGKKTLVLDIDETLVHADYRKDRKHDFHLACKHPMRSELEHFYFAFRPHLREFLDFVGQTFEVVIFTASMEHYCRPLMEHLDPQRRFPLLWRNHCTDDVKDLSRLGRDLNDVAIVDNAPYAYAFQPRNAIPITSWCGNRHDHELRDLIPMLQHLAAAPTVYDVLDVFNASRQPL